MPKSKLKVSDHTNGRTLPMVIFFKLMKGIQTLKALIKIHTTLLPCQDYKCPPSPALHAAAEILKPFYSPEGQGHRKWTDSSPRAQKAWVHYSMHTLQQQSQKIQATRRGTRNRRCKFMCRRRQHVYIYIYNFFNQVPLTLIPHVSFPYNVNVGEGAGMEDHM